MLKKKKITTKELADELNVTEKNLLVKAAILDLKPKGELTDREEQILRKIANLKTERLKGIREKDRDGILAKLNVDTQNSIYAGSKGKKDNKAGYFSQTQNVDLDLKLKDINSKFRKKINELENKTKNLIKHNTNALQFQQSDIEEIHKEIFTIRNEIYESFKSRDLALDEKLLKSLEKFEKKITSYVESFIKEFSKKNKLMFQEGIETLKNDLYDLQDQIYKIEETQKKAKYQIAELVNKRENSIHKAQINRLSEIINIEVEDRKSIDLKLSEINDIQKRLMKLGLAFPISVIQSIRNYIKRGEVLLVGPPGAGKTALLKNIRVFFENGNQIDTHYENVKPDWSSYDILGGRALFENTLSVSFGFFTESLINCIKTRRTTLVILDELNRAKPDDFLSGIMDCIASDHNQLNYSNKLIFGLLKDLIPGIKALDIPSNFRMICAMNESDTRYLFPISQSIRKRFNEVDLSCIDRDSEQKVLRKYYKHKILPFSKKIIRDEIDDFFIIIHKLRGLEKEINNSKCFFGTFYAQNTLDEMIEVQNDMDNCIDTAVKRIIIPQLKNLDTAARKRIVEDILQPYNLFNSVQLLQEDP